MLLLESYPYCRLTIVSARAIGNMAPSIVSFDTFRRQPLRSAPSLTMPTMLGQPRQRLAAFEPTRGSGDLVPRFTSIPTRLCDGRHAIGPVLLGMVTAPCRHFSSRGYYYPYRRPTPFSTPGAQLAFRPESRFDSDHLGPSVRACFSKALVGGLPCVGWSSTRAMPMRVRASSPWSHGCCSLRVASRCPEGCLLRAGPSRTLGFDSTAEPDCPDHAFNALRPGCLQAQSATSLGQLASM